MSLWSWLSINVQVAELGIISNISLADEFLNIIHQTGKDTSPIDMYSKANLLLDDVTLSGQYLTSKYAVFSRC